MAYQEGNNHIRFANGTQICWGQGTFPVGTAGEYQTIDIYFTAYFVARPYIVATFRDDVEVSSYCGYLSVVYDNPSPTACVRFGTKRIQGGGNWAVNYVAFGEWK